MSLLRRRMMMQKKVSEDRHAIELPFDTPSYSVTFVDGFFHAWNGDISVNYKNFVGNTVGFVPASSDFLIFTLANTSSTDLKLVVLSTVKSERFSGINRYIYYGFVEKTPYSGSVNHLTSTEFIYNGNSYYYSYANNSIPDDGTATVNWFNLSTYTKKIYTDMNDLLTDLLDYYYGVI